MQGLFTRQLPEPGLRLAYGAGPQQFGELRVPSLAGPHPTLVVIHGGFWRAATDLKHLSHLAQHLQIEGIATYSIEYRRLGNPGGGWPGTFDDVRTAAAWLGQNARRYNLLASRVAILGHSAGGTMALWAAGERVLPLRGVLCLSGVTDLRRAWELKLNNGVVGELLGGSPQQVDARYKAASPIERLPLKTPVRLFHGVDDNVVPLELSKRYEAAARALKEDVRLVPVPGAGHFDLIDPLTVPFRLVLSAARGMIG